MEALSFYSTTPASTTLDSYRFVSYSNNKAGGFKPSLPRNRRQWSSRKHESNISEHDIDVDCSSLLQSSRIKGLTQVAEHLLLEKKSESLVPDKSTLSALMLCCADKGLVLQAESIWDELLNSSFVPDVQNISDLIVLFGRVRHFDAIMKILHQIRDINSDMLPDIYKHAISCLGKAGQLELMEILLKEMLSMGFHLDSMTGNAFVTYYSIFGSMAEMEDAYGRLKKSRILIEEEAIRAVSYAYIKQNKFYSLGQFVEDVGLGRRNVGNLLWNLLLLSYATNFKMKSLQRQFVRMMEAGFHPDLTTFNIRALAFSKMSLFWDLHLSLEHMKHGGIVPDLVTYGCVVDAYTDRKLGRNLEFALRKMNVHGVAMMSTDPLVFEAMGKGDFHSSSELLLQFTKHKNWTYKQLLTIYLKKKFRSNQIFWNY